MMPFRATLAALMVGAATAQCGGNLKIAGSSTVFPIADEWGKNYATKCGKTFASFDGPFDNVGSAQIQVGGGGSSNGARGVCAATVDIGNMSRDWRTSEVSSSDSWNYQCLGGAKPAVTRVDVATDGLTVAVKRGGVAATCLAFLTGLTRDQLRFMYSNLSVAQLKQSGWSQTALARGKSPTSTTPPALWSTLHKSCADKEFNLCGADQANSGTADFFKEKLFRAAGETIDTGGLKPYKGFVSDVGTLDYLKSDEAAIGYFGFAYFFQNQNVVAAAKIQNRFKNFVAPSKATILGGEYDLMTRRIYMNTLKSALADTRPFLEFGYSPEGDKEVAATGYDPLPAADQILMLSRIGSTKGINIAGIACDANGVIRVGTGAAAQRIRFNIWSLLYTAKCPKVDINLVNIPSTPDASALSRACATGATALEIGATGTKAPTATYKPTAKAYILKCPNVAKNLVELQMAPGVFAYLNEAGAVFPISRGFAAFCLSELGSSLLGKISQTANPKATNDLMLQRVAKPFTPCFSGDSTVEVLNRGIVAMKDLAIGDVVKVAGGKFSQLYSFGHYDQDVEASFISIHAGLEKPLVVSGDHMVFVEGRAVAASAVRPGDKLSLVDGFATVKAIKNVNAVGVFAPFTKSGTIVVDGVVASNYVNLKGDTSLVVGGVFAFDLHFLAHMSQAPHRLVCEFSNAFCATETYNDGISVWVEKPLAFSLWLVKQNAVVMTAAFVPGFAFIFLAAAVETVISGPVLLLILVATALFMTCKIKKSA